MDELLFINQSLRDGCFNLNCYWYFIFVCLLETLLGQEYTYIYVSDNYLPDCCLKIMPVFNSHLQYMRYMKVLICTLINSMY